MKHFLLTLALISTGAHSAEVVCWGRYQNQSFRVTARGSLLNTRAGSGEVTVQGRPVADFRGDEVNMNLVLQRLSGENNRGDRVAAHVTDINAGTGIMTQLEVPSHRISWRRVPVRCSIVRN